MKQYNVEDVKDTIAISLRFAKLSDAEVKAFKELMGEYKDEQDQS